MDLGFKVFMKELPQIEFIFGKKRIIPKYIVCFFRQVLCINTEDGLCFVKIPVSCFGTFILFEEFFLLAVMSNLKKLA